MSSLVLLNRYGLVASKLQLVSLPSDYIIPEGMTVSWKMVINVSSSRSLFYGDSRLPEPVEAFFYLGNAQGQVCRSPVSNFKPLKYSHTMWRDWNLTITVQGTATKDVVELRDYIMQLIDSGVRWGVRNDLNPKPKRGFLRRLMGK